MTSSDQPAPFQLFWQLDSRCLSGHLIHDITGEGYNAFSKDQDNELRMGPDSYEA